MPPDTRGLEQGPIKSRAKKSFSGILNLEIHQKKWGEYCRAIRIITWPRPSRKVKSENLKDGQEA